MFFHLTRLMTVLVAVWIRNSLHYRFVGLGSTILEPYLLVGVEILQEVSSTCFSISPGITYKKPSKAKRTKDFNCCWRDCACTTEKP